jgi:hypothetical protein
MVHLAFLAAFLVLPIASFLVVRSLTWTVAAVTGALALGGAVVTFANDRGNGLDFATLQVITLVSLLAVLVGAVLVRRGGFAPGITLRRQLVTVIVPVLAMLALLAVSRLAAFPRTGLFTAVGFLVQRRGAEDNAKWLDFTGQLVTGHEIVQGVPMGGALQLFLVIIATGLAAISVLAFGGVNEVLVAANSVVYAELLLAAMVPFAFAPLAEARVRLRSGSRERGFIPAPLLWAGMLVLAVGVLAGSGLGHLTLEFVLVSIALWVALFVIGSKAPHAYLLTSLAAVAITTVWFPLLPVSLVVAIAGIVAIVAGFVRADGLRRGPWVAAVLWLAMIVLTWTTFTSTLRYMTDTSTAAGASFGGGGGIRASAPLPALLMPALDLLTSQGGTEIVAPALGVLVVIAVVLACMNVVRRRSGDSRLRLVVALAPGALIGAYAIALSILGTWWAGSGPAYGALKSTFMASIVLLAVAVPLALLEIDRSRAGTTLVRLAGIAGVVYLLTIDTLMPRAFTYISPQQWPDPKADSSYWALAEVRSEADQPIAKSPIGCAYYLPGQHGPSALPNGQTAYSCTRILAGLAGSDTTAQPLVDWMRREWLTNTPAWDNEYPGISKMPEDVRRRDLILMDEYDNVTGLDSVQSFLDRFYPPNVKPGG